MKKKVVWLRMVRFFLLGYKEHKKTAKETVETVQAERPTILNIDIKKYKLP